MCVDTHQGTLTWPDGLGSNVQTDLGSVVPSMAQQTKVVIASCGPMDLGSSILIFPE